jgi:hypothetical protein
LNLKSTVKWGLCPNLNFSYFYKKLWEKGLSYKYDECTLQLLAWFLFLTWEVAEKIKQNTAFFIWLDANVVGILWICHLWAGNTYRILRHYQNAAFDAGCTHSHSTIVVSKGITLLPRSERNGDELLDMDFVLTLCHPPLSIPLSVFREYLVQMVNSLVSLLGFRFGYCSPLPLWQVGFYVRNYITLHMYWYMKMGIIATDVTLQIWDDQKGKGLNLWNTGEEKE